MEFFRQEYWSGLPFPSPGDLPGPGIKPRSPTLQAEALPLRHEEIPNENKSISKCIIVKQQTASIKDSIYESCKYIVYILKYD